MLRIIFTDIVHSIRFLTGISVFVGSVLLALAFWIKKQNFHLMADILRDIGIACYVAVIVTGIYELHVRQILDTEKSKGVLSTVLKYNVPPSVWDEVSTHVLDSKVIRRNVIIDFEIKPDPSLPCPHCW